MMVDNGQLQMQVGDVVQMPDGLYRVLVMTPNCGIFIQIETTRLNILRFSMDFVKYQISIGGIKRSDWKDEARSRKMRGKTAASRGPSGTGTANWNHL